MADAKKIVYFNPSSSPVKFEIGEKVGEPWTVYECAGDGTMEGWESYAAAFKRLGGLIPFDPGVHAAKGVVSAKKAEDGIVGDAPASAAASPAAAPAKKKG